ncbi:MAG: hypothetical protein FWB73_00445 [Treponema sp.]|nr:hypothetical protein [Treponema sp.]
MDNTYTIGDALRSSFSTFVNKDGKIFKAFIANPKGDGTIEQILNDVEKVRDAWCNNSDVYNQTGEQLEKTLSFFSFLERTYGESDESLKRRNELLFYRDGDTIWGDVWNIRKIFQKYFNTKYIYIVNNTNPINENLLKDGDFEARNAWELDGCSYDEEARFCESTGIKFADSGTCKQTVEVNQDSTYFLHFFVEGKIEVEIKDNKGRYWNKQNGEFGSWSTEIKRTEYSSDIWDAKNIFFITDNEVSSVTITFIGLRNQSAFLDYVRLFLKEAYSTFTLLVVFGGIYTEDTLGFAPGTNDFHLNEKTPLELRNDDKEGEMVDYQKMSYIEQSHIFGIEGSIEKAKEIYTELLEMVGAGGIIYYIEILTKELD